MARRVVDSSDSMERGTIEMQGIAGWYGRPQDPAVLERMLRRLGPGALLTAARSGARATVGVSGRETLCCLAGEGEVSLALHGHARLRTSGEATTAAAARRLLARYCSEGRLPLADLQGDFSLALVDPVRERVILAIDRVGVATLSYTVTGTQLLFGTTLDVLAGHPECERRLNRQALFDYVYFHVVPGSDTIVTDQRRVPPGCAVVFEHGATRLERYWQMRFDEPGSQDVERESERFRDLLLTATRRSVQGARCGAFLSGGTDSSTVTGYLARATSRAPETFSIGFRVDGFDEMDYARVTAKHFAAEHHEYYVTADDIVADAPRVAAAYDQPFGNASALAAYRCARMARENGIERLLAGDGGDELFGGNVRYARNKVLAMYSAVPAGLRNALESIVPGAATAGRLAPLRKIRSYMDQAAPPMPERYETYNLLDRFGHTSVFEPDFLTGLDAQHPRALLREAHAPFADLSLINQMLGIDLRFTLADSDLPKVTRMCQLAGVDVAFPLLDDDIVKFSGELAPWMKLRGLKLRWLFKHALREFLPAEVLTKKKHGFGVPAGNWMLTHAPLRDLAFASIDSLRGRGIFRPQFLAELTGPLLREHPDYYGVMVWVLMMLGLWMQDREL